MPYLTAAVVLVGLLGVFNLMLTLRLARLLKEQGAGHDHAGPAVSAGPPVTLGAGSRPAPFSAVTTAGEPVSEDFTGVVAFFTEGCDPCHKQAPLIAEYARSAPDRVLAVIGGDDAALLELLAPVAHIVVEAYDGPVSSAFQNEWTPALYLVGPDGLIAATGGRLSDLPLEATV